MRFFIHPPEAEVSTLFLAALKEMGGLALIVSMMLLLACRDPERNVAIIDAFSQPLLRCFGPRSTRLAAP
jgi:hypothetical protein